MRDTTKLHPLLQAKLKYLQEECEKAGLKIGIGECVRTKAEQDSLYAQGRTTAGKIVTKVKYPNSMHCWGVAFDIYENDGKGAYADYDNFFKKVAKISRDTVGLEAGAFWTSFVDLPHHQLKYWGSTPSKLIAKYGTPEKYMATWFKVGDKIKCTTSVYLWAKAGTTKAKFDDLSDAMKEKCVKQDDGTAKFKVGKTTTIVSLAFCKGQVYAKTKAGQYVKIIDGDNNNKFTRV